MTLRKAFIYLGAVPQRGAHSAEILRAAGLSDDEIVQLLRCNQP